MSAEQATDQEAIAYAYEYRVTTAAGPGEWTESVAEVDPRKSWDGHDGIEVQHVRPLVEARST